MTDDAKQDWYQGTADAVRKQLRYIQQPGVDYVVILSGDQLYRMEYRDGARRLLSRDGLQWRGEELFR